MAPRGPQRATGTVPTPFGSRNYYVDLRHTGAPGSAPASAGRPEDGHDSEAYAALCARAESGDPEVWDAWREENPGLIFLEGVNLAGANLTFVNLSNVHLSHANLKNADLHGANLTSAWLLDARMEGAHLYRANLDDANVQGARLQGANMIEASLKGANARYTFLQGANLHHTSLQGADFSYAIVDGETLVDTDKIDSNTDFTSVGLSSARLRPGLIESLMYNIRRRRWFEWYSEGSIASRAFKNCFVRPFWWVSDYGFSTIRILGVFSALALVYTVIFILNPDSITGLSEDEGLSKYYRTVYFAVVTMVTLGFGNMNANPNSLLGNTTVMLQIISGYMILAALVTRISILFSSGGPELPMKKTHRTGDASEQ